MQGPELDAVLAKVGDFDGRTFSSSQHAAWREVLCPHTQADALAAVLAFYSKPFTRRAYPGDIKALILELEAVRLRRCGTVEANDEEWVEGPPAEVHAKLRRLVASGKWAPDVYRNYRRSKLTLDQYIEKQGAPVG